MVFESQKKSGTMGGGGITPRPPQKRAPNNMLATEKIFRYLSSYQIHFLR